MKKQMLLVVTLVIGVDTISYTSEGQEEEFYTETQAINQGNSGNEHSCGGQEAPIPTEAEIRECMYRLVQERIRRDIEAANLLRAEIMPAVGAMLSRVESIVGVLAREAAARSEIDTESGEENETAAQSQYSGPSSFAQRGGKRASVLRSRARLYLMHPELLDYRVISNTQALLDEFRSVEVVSKRKALEKLWANISTHDILRRT